MALMDEASVDAIVCDPPYELGFMGKGWDRTGVANRVETWRAALRVLKPGGHLVAFGGTRTYHRMVCAVEDAGFEIRDTLAWLYGQGFPKSHNLHGDWEGWGTALKPAHEPIVLARKPLQGTVAANVQRFGVGALNVDGCRIPLGADDDTASVHRQHVANPLQIGGAKPGDEQPMLSPSGRWPANLLLDDEAAAILDEQSGTLTSGRLPAEQVRRTKRSTYGEPTQGSGQPTFGGDSGGASRFFAVFGTTDEPTIMGACSTANPADKPSSQPSQLDASAPSPAPIGGSQGEPPSSGQLAPSTNATPNASDGNGGNATPPTPNTGRKFSPVSLHPSGSDDNPASNVEPNGLTGTMTITTPLSPFDGCADPVIYDFTLPGLEVGGADSARFRYCAKASSRERNQGLDGFEAKTRPVQIQQSAGRQLAGRAETLPTRNPHPTVKPIALMRWLCRLVTPPGGLILDPFAGSGSTLIAAHLEGFDGIGIELDPEYARIAEARLQWWQAQPQLDQEEAPF